MVISPYQELLINELCASLAIPKDTAAASPFAVVICEYRRDYLPHLPLTCRWFFECAFERELRGAKDGPLEDRAVHTANVVLLGHVLTAMGKRKVEVVA